MCLCSGDLRPTISVLSLKLIPSSHSLSVSISFYVCSLLISSILSIFILIFGWSGRYALQCTLICIGAYVEFYDLNLHGGFASLSSLIVRAVFSFISKSFRQNMLDLALGLKS